MLASVVQRIFDPAVGGTSRAATATGLSVALIVGLAALLSGAGPVAVLWGAAALVGVALPVRFVYRSQSRSIQEIRDLWGLQGLMQSGTAWPAPEGWALGAGALSFLIKEVKHNDHRTLVELGPGVSSVVLGSANPDLDMFGLEHDERFFDLVSDQLADHGIDDYELIHAPLETDRDEQWYSRRALDQLPDQIDVLVVDGPPNWRGQGRRRPAWGNLASRLNPGGLVLVDDTHRHDERRMATDWLRENGVELEFDGGEFMALRVVEQN
jgi:hypothetical protein